MKIIDKTVKIATLFCMFHSFSFANCLPYSLIEKSVLYKQAESQLNDISINKNLNSPINLGVFSHTNYTGSHQLLGKTVDSDINTIVGVNLNWGILPWSNSQLSIKTTNRQFEIAKINLKSTYNKVHHALTENIANYNNLKKDIEITEMNLKSAKRMLEIATIKHSQKNLKTEELESAKNKVLLTEIKLDSLKLNLSNIKNQFENILDTYIDEKDLVDCNLQIYDINKEMPKNFGILSIVQAENNLILAQEELNAAARRTKLPQLELKTNYGSGGAGLSTNLDISNGNLSTRYVHNPKKADGKDIFSMDLSASYTLFSPTELAHINSLKSNLNQREKALMDAIYARNEEWLNLVKEIDLNLSKLEVAKINLDIAKRKLENMQIDLKNGLVTKDHLFEATIELKQAEKELLAISNQIAINQSKMGKYE